MYRKLGFALIVVSVLGVIGMAQVIETEPNEAPNQATVLGVLDVAPVTFTVAGQVDYAGDADWYTMSVTAPEIAVVVSVEANNDLQIVLYDADVAFIASETQELAVTLSEGVYYFRLQATELIACDYAIYVSNAIENESNDGLVEATPLGVIADNSSLVAYAAIDPEGDMDMFQFTVPEGFLQSCRIETAGTQGGDTVIVVYALDLALQRYVPILRDDDGGPGGWSAVYLTNPQPGSYIVRVDEFGHSDRIERYRFSVSSFQTDVEPNGTMDTAIPLGTVSLQSPLSAAGLVAAGDADFYAFSVPETSADACPTCEDCLPIPPEVTISTYGYPQPDGSGDTVISVYNEAGDELFSDDDGGNNFWSSITEDLVPGNYFVKIEGIDYDSVFEYGVIVSMGCPILCTDEIEPNDNLLGAHKLPAFPDVSPRGLCLSGEISRSGDIDAVQFVLEEDATVVIETSGDSGDSYICLYDAFEALIECDDDGGQGVWSKIEIFLRAGTYYVFVEGYDGLSVFEYVLEVSILD